jgi:hypothetical protein
MSVRLLSMPKSVGFATNARMSDRTPDVAKAMRATAPAATQFPTRTVRTTFATSNCMDMGVAVPAAFGGGGGRTGRLANGAPLGPAAATAAGSGTGVGAWMGAVAVWSM